MARERGRGAIIRRGRSWAVAYYADGIQVRETITAELRAIARDRKKLRLNDDESRRVAERILALRMGQKIERRLPAAQTAKVSVGDLASAFFSYRRSPARLPTGGDDPDDRAILARRLRGIDWQQKRWGKNLAEPFGDRRAAGLGLQDLEEYVTERKKEGADNGTVNRELALLRTIFNHELRTAVPRIAKMPAFPPRLPENKPRQGFVNAAEYARLAAACVEPWLRAFLAVAYKYGFRKGELLGMRVRQIDLTERSISLPRGTTKNAEPRTVKMAMGGEVERLLAGCVADRGPLDFVFRRGEKPVRDFRRAWAKLIAAAGLPGLLAHDLRRSAVRNMIRAGVQETVAMKISGHRTREVFERYNIVASDDLEAAAMAIEHKSSTSERPDPGK